MNCKKYKLSNGAKIILAPLQETQAVTALVLVKVGSRYEKFEKSGISHFVEHLMFDGTKKRPTSQHIARELDGIGADYNAFTEKDQTGYYVKSASRHLELSIDILSDIFYNSEFTESEIAKERNVIIEEINMYEDNPLMNIGEVLEEVMFGKKEPLGWSVAGTKESVQGTKRSDITHYFDEYYRTDNLYIALAGKFEVSKALNLLRKYFGSKKIPSTKKKSFIPWKKEQTAFQSMIKKRDTEQLHAAIGFHAYSYSSKLLYPSYVLATILGGSMSSRLFVEVREKRGLAYYVRAGESVLEDTGIFYIVSGLDQKRIIEAIETIAKELRCIREQAVGKDELKRAKELLKGKTILALEDSENIASWFGKDEMLAGGTKTLKEHCKRIDAVQPKDVKKVANELFHYNLSNLAIIGNTDKEKTLKAILKKYLQ